MEIRDWIAIAAIFLGPVVAIQVQKIKESVQEKRKLKQNIFTVLMSTRAQRLSPDHVKALNMIDVAFYGPTFFGKRLQNKKDRAVVNEWKNYISILRERNTKFKGDAEAWNRASADQFMDLLFAMTQSLDYQFDETALKNDWYRPLRHDTIEQQQLANLEGWTRIVSGQQPLRMEIVNWPLPPAEEPPGR